MPNVTLDEKLKKKILSFIEESDYTGLVILLDSLSTKHAGTPKTDIKRFTTKEIIKHISKIEDVKKREKTFFDIGKKYCNRKEPVAQEIGVAVIWKGYNHNKKETADILLKISDSSNWEVREYAAGAFINILRENSEVYKIFLAWRNHKSENVRRAVVFSALAYKESKDAELAKAFEILEPLMSDSSIYVKKNLGPFILGSHLGNHHPEEVFAQLKKWLNIKNEHAKWNIAMTFNNSFGHKYPARALEILRELSKDESKVVSRAVISTLRHLNKRHAKLVQEFVKKEKIKI